MRELEERHRQILDAITDLVLVKGAGSKIIWGNKAFRAAYGMTNEQLQGLVDAPFVEPDSTLHYIRDDTHVFQTGEMLDIPDEPLTCHDGQVLRVHTVKSPIFDLHGKVVMTVGVSRDITDRKRMEAQLLLADRMASVGTLAAGIAHEINNPLSYVMSNLELIAEELREGEVSDRHRRKLILELVDQARDGAERVRSIVRGLKTFSRADEEQRVPLDLVRVIDLAINMAWNEIRHRARVVKDFGAVPLVEADETRLAQVFINLLVNAAHALPEGNADANQIRVVTSTDARGRAVIKLSDTGQGIRPEQLSRIFDPFFTTKPVGVGTGLGLSICHGIVTGLGGDISAKSQVGVGTTFTIVLPAALELASAPEARRATTAPPSTGRRGRVLIVDDDPAVAATLMRALSKEHDVVVVHEGRAALDLFRAGECYDVFFCDLMMPVVTGMEVHAELSKISPAQVENMVIITGGAFSKQAREFLDAVPNERIDKPFGIQNVRALVRRMVH